jgi:hypothetical protein
MFSGRPLISLTFECRINVVEEAVRILDQEGIQVIERYLETLPPCSTDEMER